MIHGPHTAAAAGRVEGGCDECDAYQELRQELPGVWMVCVRHDNACPTLARHRRRRR